MNRIFHILYNGALYCEFRLYEKYRRELDFDALYNLIWCTLFFILVFTACIPGFLAAHFAPTPMGNPVSLGISFVLILMVCVHFLVRNLKRNRFVEQLHEAYSAMPEERQKQLARRGFWLGVLPILLYPMMVFGLLALL